MTVDHVAERAKVFTALLELGTSAVYAVSQKTGITRHYTGEYLRQLANEEKAIMAESKTMQGKRFVTFTPIYPKEYKPMPKVYNMALRANPGMMI